MTVMVMIMGKRITTMGFYLGGNIPAGHGDDDHEKENDDDDDHNDDHETENDDDDDAEVFSELAQSWEKVELESTTVLQNFAKNAHCASITQAQRNYTRRPPNHNYDGGDGDPWCLKQKPQNKE